VACVSRRECLHELDDDEDWQVLPPVVRGGMGVCGARTNLTRGLSRFWFGNDEEELPQNGSSWTSSGGCTYIASWALHRKRLPPVGHGRRRLAVDSGLLPRQL
jgi:hypothetical protein